MRTQILFFLSFSLLITACKPKVDESYCDAYFNGGPTPQPGIHERYPGYKMARFSDDSELAIFSIKENENKSKVVRYKVEKGKTKIVYEQKDKIQIFDYSDSGDMAFIHQGKLFVLAEGESNSVEVVFSEDIFLLNGMVIN